MTSSNHGPIGLSTPGHDSRPRQLHLALEQPQARIYHRQKLNIKFQVKDEIADIYKKKQWP